MAEKIVFASGKGGVGKSTCVAGIALALKELGKKVLLVDFDVSLSSLDVILGAGESVICRAVCGICWRLAQNLAHDGVAQVPSAKKDIRITLCICVRMRN